MKIGNIRCDILKIPAGSLPTHETASDMAPLSDPYVLAILRRLSPSADEIAADENTTLEPSGSPSKSYSNDGPTILPMGPSTSKSNSDKSNSDNRHHDTHSKMTADHTRHHADESASDELLENSFELTDFDDIWLTSEDGPSAIATHEVGNDGWFDFGPSPYPPVIGGFPLLDDLPPGSAHLA